ncbi:MAG: type IV pilus modification PilV family protein [Verrucomicrobiota bacterium]
MLLSSKQADSGFSLIDTMVGTFVMGLVIAGGLTGLGQATLLSEKSQEQAQADHILRTEVEELRGMDWSELEAFYDAVKDHQASGKGDYPGFSTLDQSALEAMNLLARVKADALNASGENGKIIFHLSLDWSDKTGKTHAESRVLVVTEGGLSAND